MFVLLLSWTIISPAKASDYYSTLTGTISHIRDGDTIEVGNIPIRIAALNCPENDTPEGQSASAFALQFKGSKVICELTGAMSCLLYTSPSPRDVEESRMPSSA